MPKKVKLDFSKFQRLTDGKGYILGTAYVDRGSIRFLECRTPIQQKTFIIHVPERYSLIPSDLKIIEITPSEEIPSARQIEHIISIRGDTLTCDLASILSTGICSCVSGQPAKKYSIISLEGEDADIELMEDDEQVVRKKDKIDRAVDVLRKIDPDLIVPPIPLEEEEAQISDNDTIELVFEDDDGNEVDDVTEAFKLSLAGLGDIDGELGEIEFGDVDNSIPDDLEDEDISLGIVYLMVQIKDFFKSVGQTGYEDEVIKIYDTMYENEMKRRDTRLKTIDSMCNDLRSSSKKRLSEISNEEKNLRVQLMRLTMVLKQSNAQLKKVMSNKEKYGEDIVAEVVTIKTGILETIHGLNLELIKQRELADEILSDFESSLKELSEI